MYPEAPWCSEAPECLWRRMQHHTPWMSICIVMLSWCAVVLSPQTLSWSCGGGGAGGSEAQLRQTLMAVNQPLCYLGWGESDLCVV